MRYTSIHHWQMQPTPPPTGMLSTAVAIKVAPLVTPLSDPGKGVNVTVNGVVTLCPS